MHESHIPISPLANVLGSVYAANCVAYQNNCLKGSRDVRFWDIVIVTACNQDQRTAYLQRIRRKLARREIPSTAEYLVIEDPPGTKISSGGSTIYVMHTLQNNFKDRPDVLAKARILLIHAGGYSSRLPHVSACGKLFMAIPQRDSKGIEVFDIKLILYLHLLKTMPPGVFVTSADGIELFASKTPFPSTTSPFRITALAHPSPLDIATTHGVFELAAESLRAQELGDMMLDPQERSASLHKCLRFHHKPSLAIVLAKLFPDLPRRCDLEAWADILHFQDTSPRSSGTSPTPAHSFAHRGGDDDHSRGRAMVQRALQEAGVQLDLLVLNASRFYHLGTMTEFLDAVCLDVNFMAAMGIENTVPGLGMVTLTSPIFTSMTLPSPSRSNKFLNTYPSGSLASDAFVTFTFSTKDDMKKPARTTSDASHREPDATAAPWWETLCIFETIPVSKVLSPSFFTGAMSSASASSDEKSSNISLEVNHSLWDAPIFEVAATQRESTLLALQRLARVTDTDSSYWLQETIHISGWISLKDAAEKSRPHEIQNSS
ncbi:hypothetical protein BGZ73_005545 [Actinomortierella ambigua]|nr:hypothetical protein BGZ73_005545 [Actinomortierella ambigua]